MERGSDSKALAETFRGPTRRIAACVKGDMYTLSEKSLEFGNRSFHFLFHYPN